MNRPPRLLADLAIPRDIAPEVGELAGVRLYNIDTLGCAVARTLPPEGEAILEEALERFRAWAEYRESLPAIQALKDAVRARVLSGDLAGLDAEESAVLAAEKTVELLTGNLKGCFTAEDLRACAQKIRAHTRT